MSLACRRNTYLWQLPTNNSPTVSNRSSEMAKGHTSAADKAIFKNRAWNIKCSFGCDASSAVLFKSNVGNILLFNFCEQKFVQHGPITIAIDCNDLSLLIFEEKCPSYASGPKPAPNSDSFWVFRLFNVCVRVFCSPNVTIFQIGIFCKSITGHLAQHCSSVYTTIFVRRKDKTNYLSNQTWAKCYHSRNKH